MSFCLFLQGKIGRPGKDGKAGSAGLQGGPGYPGKIVSELISMRIYCGASAHQLSYLLFSKCVTESVVFFKCRFYGLVTWMQKGRRLEHRPS